MSEREQQQQQYKITNAKVFEEYCKDYHKTERTYDWDRFNPESGNFYTGWAKTNNQNRWAFFINGKLSCPFGAAIIDEGKYPKREYVLDNEFLKDVVDLAQKVVERYGEEIPTSWFNVKNGLHRVALYDVDGYFITRNGNYDSVHGEPAFVSFNKKSKARSEISWHKDGEKHRLNGPAFSRKDERDLYFIDGELFSSKEEWEKEVEKLNKEKEAEVVTTTSDINDPNVWEAYCKDPDGSEVYFDSNYGDAFVSKGADNNYTGWAKGNINGNLRAFFINGKISCPYGKALYWTNSKTVGFLYNGKQYKTLVELLDANKEAVPTVQFTNDVSTDFNGVVRLAHSDSYGTFKDGKLHSINDEPSFVSRDASLGRKDWHKNGKRHRKTGPAVVNKSTNEEFYYLDGVSFKKETWENKLRQQEETNTQEPTSSENQEENPDRIKYKKVKSVEAAYHDKTFTGAVIDEEGKIAFLKEGKYHREDGPAFLNPKRNNRSIYEGWWLNGVQHNLNGPARVNNDGSNSYYINGNWIRKENFAKEVAKHKESHPEFISIQERNEREASMESHKKVESYAHFDGIETFTGSVIDAIGLVCYYKNGKKHREDGPAFINTKNNPDWVPSSFYCDGVRYGTLENDDWKQAVKKYQEENKKLDEKWEEFSKDMKDTEPKAAEEEIATTVPSEKEEVAYRLAQKQLKSLVRHALADEMSQGSKAKRSMAFDFLGTELGSSLVVASMGVLLPKLENKLPEKYRKHLGRLNREFRVAGLAAVGTEALELVTGALGTKTRNILEATLPTTAATAATVKSTNGQLETVLVTSQSNTTVAR